LAVKPPKHENVPGLAALVFDGPSGEALLRHLREVFYDKQVFKPGLDALSMAYHDGQRYLCHYLFELVKQGKSGVKPPTQTTTEEE
jgi:hypothetical protein